MLLRLLVTTILCGAFLLGASRQIVAQPAEAKFKEGEAARQKSDWTQAFAAFQAAVDLNPEYFEAHQGLINAKRTQVQKQTEADKKKGVEYKESWLVRSNRELKAFYEGKIEKQPNIAAFHWALANILDCCDVPNAVKSLKRAIELNPKFIQAYDGLSNLAWRIGKFSESRDYEKKTYEIEPNSAERLFRYAEAELLVDKANGRKLLREVVNRFPKDNYAVFSYSQLVDSYESEKDRTKILEEMRKRFSDSKPDVISYRMSNLFGIYVRNEEPKAFQLADEMLRKNTKDTDWKTHFEFIKNILEARKLLKNKQNADARQLLEKTKPLHLGIDHTALNLLKAEAVNDNAKAYKILTDALIASPNERLEKALNEYGKKLGKTPKTVEEELWNERVSKAKPFKEFDLAVFPLEQNKRISLKSLKNKVVLVNFWFPGCVYCRDEYPLVESALKKYRSRGFEVLGMNLVAEEDNEVVPFMNQTRYSFLPVQTPGAKWARETYGVWAAPTNFLLDGEGRIIFEPSIRDGYTAKIFEREVELLLARLQK